MAYLATGGSLQSTATAAAAIATDPYLPELVGLVLELQSAEKSSPSGGGPGVGLRNIVGPLRTYIKLQEKPWILPVVVTGIFGVIFAAGYFTRKVQRD
jgi:hypothetical protein